MIPPAIEEQVDEKRGFFRLVITAPASLPNLIEDWRDQAWDLTVQRAHECGYVPVGPVLVEDPEPLAADQQTPAGMAGVMTGSQMFMAGALGITGPVMCRIVTEVAIGAVTRGEDRGGK